MSVLTKLYEICSLPISSEKYKDLQVLKRFCSPTNHQFFDELPHSGSDTARVNPGHELIIAGLLISKGPCLAEKIADDTKIVKDVCVAIDNPNAGIKLVRRMFRANNSILITQSPSLVVVEFDTIDIGNEISTSLRKLYGKQEFKVGCIYRPNDDATTINEILKSFKRAKELRNKGLFTSIVIAGDFNLAGIEWDSDNTPRTSTQYEQTFIEKLHDNNLTQLVNFPTFIKNSDESAKTTLDYIIMNQPERLDQLLDLPPLGATCRGRGHLVLTWHYLLNKSTTSNYDNNLRKKYAFDKGNYELIKQYFNKIDWESKFTNSIIDEDYEYFIKEYILACNKFIPIRNNKNNTNNFEPWINKTAKIKHKLYYRAKSNNWRRTQKTKSKYNRAAKQVKKEIFKSTCTFERHLAHESKKNPQLIYAYINKRQQVKCAIRSLYDKIGNITNDQINIANTINNQLQSVFVKEPDDEPVFPIITEHKCSLLTILQDINEQTIKIRIENVDTSKSIGGDNIHPFVLKHASVAIAIPLSLIFKKSLATQTVPKNWTEANVTPVFKQGNRLLAENYRPISLTSIVCKILEKIVREALTAHLELTGLLSNSQHGFTTKKSSVSNLLETLNTITKALAQGHNVEIIYLDYAKAFDTVPHKRLLAKLLSYGIENDLVK
ncbi:uncharacterized protein LOC136094158 [Hydra vulgaris]|uniref:uncharacterized protein LOC136094158 n=1 Tax=Hydra vulgaris TaxID=6087 RepID=UPI0032EA4CF7